MGRLANVSGAVLCAGDADPHRVSELRARLAELFVEVEVVGSPGVEVPMLELLERALAGSEAERVLVVPATAEPPGLRLLAGLIAWPGADWVRPAGSACGCAIAAREKVLGATRAARASGAGDLEAVESRLSVSRVEGEDLALLR